MTQHIYSLCPSADIRCDIKKHIITGEQKLLITAIKTYMTKGVTRGDNALQIKIAIAKMITVKNRLILARITKATTVLINAMKNSSGQ